jgi:hypothetical protein
LKRYFSNSFVIYYSVGLCSWKCNPKSLEECGESIFEKVLGKMESKPYWSHVSIFYHSIEVITYNSTSKEDLQGRLVVLYFT